MENYIGKICPFCKTEIQEGDSVKVCPACNIPHHEDCWEENKGCTTFGCSELHYEAQHTNPTDVCQNCGAPLGDGQAFCPKCGTFRDAPKKNVCNKCGTELQDGQEFCPTCGQKAGFAVDSNVNSAISQFNAGIEKKKKRSKALPIILAVAAVVAIIVGVFVFHTLGAKKAEEAKKEYIANVEEFLSLALTAGSNLEDIADTIQEYWYESIWEDKHGSDINDAILYAMIDKSAEITEAETLDGKMTLRLRVFLMKLQKKMLTTLKNSVMRSRICTMYIRTFIVSRLTLPEAITLIAPTTPKQLMNSFLAIEHWKIF